MAAVKSGVCLSVSLCGFCRTKEELAARKLAKGCLLHDKREVHEKRMRAFMFVRACSVADEIAAPLRPGSLGACMRACP